jgi:thiol-disulfide isomerase/thioredoxin
MKSLKMIVGCLLVVSFCAAQTTAVHCSSGDPPTGLDSPLSSEIELRDLTGHVTHLSDLRGEPVILNFWATWCPPCRRELPWLVAVQKKYGSQGLRVVGITMDEAENPEVAKLISEAQINYLLLFGTLESSLSYLDSQGLPVTLYVDKNGKLWRKVLGATTQQDLERKARELLEVAPKVKSSPNAQKNATVLRSRQSN